MNSGGSNNLNCIKIDPRTGEEFSFNLDIGAATAWQHPQQCTFIHAHESFHVSSNGGVFVIVLYITSLLSNEIGRYLKYIQKRKSAKRGVTHDDFLGPCMDLLVTSYCTLTLYCMTARLREWPAAFPSFARYYFLSKKKWRRNGDFVPITLNNDSKIHTGRSIVCSCTIDYRLIFIFLTIEFTLRMWLCRVLPMLGIGHSIHIIRHWKYLVECSYF